jgi:hypothetical protein
MKRIFTTGVLGAALAFYPAAASAQETGSLIIRKAAQLKSRGKEDVRQVMLDFAACLTDRSRGRVAKIINAPVDSGQYQSLMRSIFDRSDDACLSGGGVDSDGIGQLSFSSSLMRGALFNAVYMRDFARAGPVEFSAVTDSGYIARYSTPYSSAAQSAIALEKYGECIARSDGENARALITAIAGSPQESVAFVALGPKFSACLMAGNKMEFSKAMLRGVVAEGLYWLSASTTALRAGAPK